MANENEENIEVLVLKDQKGNFYGISRKSLEEHRLTGEQLAEVQRQLGSEAEDSVTGYGVDDRFLPAEDQTKGVMPIAGDHIAAGLASADAAAENALLTGQYLPASAASPSVIGWMLMLPSTRIPI